ncbi:MAG: fucose isomerase [Spirochaetaceae bacterium]|jgi:L-fucose mutarotase|nr:fucose isomerase [Spirochaetaceae bacterium]
MLKNIPPVISPELMKALMEMGHNDYIVLADANYPGMSGARRAIRLDGVPVDTLLDAVMRFFPLDSFVEYPVTLMRQLPDEPTPEIWSKFDEILRKWDAGKAYQEFRLIGRMEFYEYARGAYTIVQTGTTARYANIALQKGVV